MFFENEREENKYLNNRYAMTLWVYRNDQTDDKRII